jgi:hypothetical protein
MNDVCETWIATCQIAVRWMMVHVCDTMRGPAQRIQFDKHFKH